MARSHRTTESTKRYTFKSFRDRVDDIKIEPSKNLKTRAFDEVDDSHFISSLDRWVEFNRSAKFTHFVFDVRDIAQSLPQIIYFKERIFDLLFDAISEQDSTSLQPLLELLTQFCHDLGPDFMVFYEKSIQMITELALGENNADTLEWEFNALAFIFKYLSKTLSQDLLPTFNLLEPLLKTKNHIARFCSEALSFLIRKTNSKQLSSFTNFAFDKLEDDVQYQKSFVILFSEALKSTKGSIHSKSTIILGSLMDRIGTNESSSVISDILINIIGHGTQENVDGIYSLILEKLSLMIKSDFSFINHYIKILISLIFADSGKKVPDWNQIIDAVKYITVELPEEQEPATESKKYLVYLFTVLVRNCELQELTMFHNTLFKYSMTLDDLFLPFIISITNISKNKALKFAPTYVKSFINSRWKSHAEEIGLFIQELDERNLLSVNVDDPTKFRIVLPQALCEAVHKDLHNLQFSESNDLYNVYWRLSLLSAGSSNFNSDNLVQLFQRLLKFDDSSKFRKLVLSMIIHLLVENNSPDIKSLILENFSLLSSEQKFIFSATKFIKTNSEMVKDPMLYIQIASKNLSGPNKALRLETLYLINALASSADEEIVTISNQASIIEQLPLDFSNSRDFGIRIRNFSSTMRNLESKDDLKSEIFFRSLFGFLNEQFAPMWKAVFEVLPSVSHKNEKLLWELAFSFITHNKGEENQEEFFSFFKDEDALYQNKWIIVDARLESMIGSVYGVVSKYISCKNTILSNAELKYDNIELPEVSSTNALKALKTVPYIAEKNSDALASLILDNNEYNETQKNLLNRKDQMLIYEIFGAFKKLQLIPKAEELREKFLNLLSHKVVEIRKLALNVLFNYHNNSINKYKDNLNNLLDDAVFRDEITKIFAKNGDSVVEDSDLDQIMPIILRILYGRAKSHESGGNKKGLKVSSIHTLVNMESNFVEQFLQIVSEKIPNEVDLENTNEDFIDVSRLKICLGYVSLLPEIITTLGEKYVAVLPNVLKPLLFCLVQAQSIINSESQHDEASVAIAKKVRKAGSKDLFLLFKLLRDFNWDEYLEVIYDKIFTPRFAKFESENQQQPSSILKILVSWSEYEQYFDLLLVNDLEPASKILSILSYSDVKPEVLNTIFEFSTNVISLIPEKKKFAKLKSLVAESVFVSLNRIFDGVLDQDLSANAVSLLLALVQKKHVKDQERRLTLVELSTKLLEKPLKQISKQSKIQVLQTLKPLVDDFEGEFSDIQHLYEVCSKFLKQITDRDQRDELVEVFVSIGEKFEDYIKVASLVQELNSFSKRRMDFDFDRRLVAYREINDELYSKFSMLEWLPILNDSFYSINIDDLAIRTSASFTLRRFIDAFSMKESLDEDMLRYLRSLFLPTLRTGLKNKNQMIQFEFIGLLSHIVSKGKFVDDFKDMKVLLFEGDLEADFFANIIHVQLYRRQQAIKSLVGVCDSIKDYNIASYILPIVESYACCSDDKMRNISNDAIETIEHLVANVSYDQYSVIFRRYLSGLREGSTFQRDFVNLMNSICRALSKNLQDRNTSRMQGLPEDHEIMDAAIEKEMIEPVSKIFSIRNEGTVVSRTPLIQSLAALSLGLSEERIISVLPGILTKACQVLRTRYDDLREAMRKHLGKAAKMLGAKYLKFIIKELKTALGRGFQVHVLGFTVNSILLATELKHGDLDESASLIMDVVMENLFGSVSQEKEADGYRNTMKEVRSNKSFDTAEMLTQLISLSNFGDVIRPIKLILKERITHKLRTKLDELLRRMSLGIGKNEELKTQEMLVLCFQLFQDSEEDDTVSRKRPNNANIQDKDEHFLVQLDAKPLHVETESSIYVDTLQRVSLELLSTALSKNPDFISVEKLNGFLPCFGKALQSENEAVLVDVLRILIRVVKVEFESEKDIFESSAQKCLEVIQDYPSTEAEVVQVCFKYLSTIIRHREDLTLKESSLGYLLTKIQPDMNDQNKQGLVFNFLKAIVAKRVMIPEVYDTMDKIREVMVTSHSKERRDGARSIYFQFIMEYDQGRGRLEKQFKFLVDNLSYPSEEGKQSVMELIHLIINKSGEHVLEALSSSFFVGLAKVLISETEPKTRQMSISLITSIFEKMGTEKYDKYILGWMNSKNSSLLKCSLQLYRIKLKVDGIDKNNLRQVDEDVLINIKDALEKSRSDSEIEISWELIYSSLNCLDVLAEKSPELIDEELKDHIISALLYPHSWIRLVSSRIVSMLISKEGALTDSDIQDIANRLIHQLRAPAIDESLCSQAVKFLTLALMKWENESIKFDESLVKHENEEVNEEEEEVEVEGKVEEDAKKEMLVTDWVIKKISTVIRAARISHFSKKACIQLLAMTVQVLDKSRVSDLSFDIMFPLFGLTDTYSELEKVVELRDLSLECMKMIDEKIGVSDYTASYNKVRTTVLAKRQERKGKRALLAFNEPEIFAKKKMRKNEKERNKRKREKENGNNRLKKSKKN